MDGFWTGNYCICPSPIGGVGREVQIDESNFTRRKYNRGRVYPNQWFFGGIDSDNDDCFMELQ